MMFCVRSFLYIIFFSPQNITMLAYLPFYQIRILWFKLVQVTYLECNRSEPESRARVFQMSFSRKLQPFSIWNQLSLANNLSFILRLHESSVLWTNWSLLWFLKGQKQVTASIYLSLALWALNLFFPNNDFSYIVYTTGSNHNSA